MGLCFYTPELYVEDNMFDPDTGRRCDKDFEDKAQEYRKEEDENPLIDDPRNDVKLPEIHIIGGKNNGVSISRPRKKHRKKHPHVGCKRHKKNLRESMDNDSFRLDGGLIVPSHHVIIRSRICVPFMHAMGQQEKSEKGLFHAVISPSMAAEITETDFNEAQKRTEVLKKYELRDIPVHIMLMEL
eukprot:scaffold95216_cov68-Attheya_sp.AAC.11